MYSVCTTFEMLLGVANHQSLLRQKAAHAETHNKMLRQEKKQYKNKHKLQTN